MTATTIVAELGLNHNGHQVIARKMIDVAKSCGVDAVKLQSYRAEDFLAPSHRAFEMFKEREIWFHLAELRDYAREVGIGFGSTPTSVEGVYELAELGVDFIKNGSDYLLRHDVLRAMGQTGIRSVISTGMATDSEIWKAYTEFVDSSHPLPHVTFLHCTSAYPCPLGQANLNRIPTLARRFPHQSIGFSDHTYGTSAAPIAVALGATMIEKHFTLDRGQDGPDHHFSADPATMRRLVDQVRITEKLLGDPQLGPTESERENMGDWRILEGATRAG